MSIINDIKQQYRASLKSMDTEEHIDLFFYRPLGFAWAWLFAKLGVTPNVVTIASIFLGVGGGILLYFGQPHLAWLNWLGIFLIIWANTYDSADGQLARLTKQYSRLGRILDGVSGDFWFVAIYIAIVLREIAFGDRLLGGFFGEHEWMIWTLAVVAGMSHAKQAATADYYRQFHLYFLKGKDGSELESTAQLDEMIATLSWKKDFMKRLTMAFYRNYTANQEALSPSMQRLRKALRQRWAVGEEPQQLRDAFREQSLPLMKYTNILSFNWRIITMFVCVLTNMPWVYFAAEVVVFNGIMAYMILSHESRCRKILQRVEAGQFD